MTPAATRPGLGVLLGSGEPERLYTGLSLLVSAAADGRPARGLVLFGALDALLADPAELERRALEPAATPSVSAGERPRFARSLGELRRAADELPGLELWACSAAVQATGVDPGLVHERLDGVMSTPRFLRALDGAALVGG